MCRTRSATSVSTPTPRSASASGVARVANNNSSWQQSGSKLPSFASSTSSSLAALRESLPEQPAFYPFAELLAATANFASSHRLSPSSSSSWRCSLRGHDAVIFHRPLRRRGGAADVAERLSILGRSHHSSLARLLGASVSDAGDALYVAYEFVPGATLAACLRNPLNPSFTPLASWLDRARVAADVAAGLDYIHDQADTIHNRLKSSAVIISDAGGAARAKICHFGVADLAGEVFDKLRRSGSGGRRIEGTRGYMAPEVVAGGTASRKSDVYAFGMILLELISGEEPLKFKIDKEKGTVQRMSLIDIAAAAAASGEREAIRRWVDPRLRDSFPVEAAERLAAVALSCVEPDPTARPEMAVAETKVSKIYLESQAWAERIRLPTDISVSFAPR